MRNIFIVALSAIVAGCAGSLGGMVGQPISAAFLEYGPPDAEIDLPDGRRAFQWERSKTVGALMPNNMGGTGYVAVANEIDCRFSVIARRNASGEWIADEVKRPDLRC